MSLQEIVVSTERENIFVTVAEVVSDRVGLDGAQRYAVLSQRYANEDEDVEVVDPNTMLGTGRFSSLHYNAKAGKSATLSERYAITPEDQEVVDPGTGTGTGNNSSLHHAAKSGASAASAAASAAEATAAENNIIVSQAGLVQAIAANAAVGTANANRILEEHPAA